MIVADSSAWIDFLNQSESEVAAELERILRADQPLAITSLILTEVLRGLRSDEAAERVSRTFLGMPFLELDLPEDHLEAAALYRRARGSGVTVRNTVDLLIATTCIKYGATLLHRDRDFDQLASVSDLSVWKPGN